MARHSYDPKCPDCRPVVLDPKTMQRLPADDPFMVIVNRVFDASSREDKEAFVNVTVHNSREPDDMRRLAELTKRIEAAGKAS